MWGLFVSRQASLISAKTNEETRDRAKNYEWQKLKANGDIPQTLLDVIKQASESGHGWGYCIYMSINCNYGTASNIFTYVKKHSSGFNAL